MATYRILRGQHAEVTGRDDRGHVKKKKVYERGSYVTSELDLERRFGTAKFRRISNDNLKSREAKKADPMRPVRTPKPINDGLDRMDTDQLRELADNDEIDISGCSTKKQLIKRIRASD